LKIEMKKNLSTIIAAAIVASLFMLPADARPKKQKRPDPQRRHEVQTTPSLDGRITGIEYA
jgi:Ni/Co efflux regulator RcnB